MITNRDPELNDRKSAKFVTIRPRNKERAMAAKTLTVDKRVCVSKLKEVPRPLNNIMGSMINNIFSGFVGLYLYLEMKRGRMGIWNFDE